MAPVKRRYVLFRVDGLRDPVAEGQLVAAVRSIVQRVHGEHGLASVLLNLHLKRFETRTGIGVLTVGRTGHRFLVSALPLLSTVAGQTGLTVSVLKLSGTLRGSLRRLQGVHGRLIGRRNRKSPVLFNVVMNKR